MQKEKRSFERFQGVDKTCVSRISTVRATEFSQTGKLLNCRVLFGRRSPSFPCPRRGEGGLAAVSPRGRERVYRESTKRPLPPAFGGHPLPQAGEGKERVSAFVRNPV